jgi:hypothetical protein
MALVDRPTRLTISTNLFATTYYSLVGLHAFHIMLGLIMFVTVLVLSGAGRARIQSGGNRRVYLCFRTDRLPDALLCTSPCESFGGSMINGLPAP